MRSVTAGPTALRKVHRIEVVLVPVPYGMPSGWGGR
jgi:hypothetical protein